MTILIAKATVAILIAFAICALARHARASFRHAVYASLFAMLLLLPFSPQLTQRLSVQVPIKSTPATTLLVEPAVQRPAEAGPHTSAPTPSLGIREIYLAGVVLMLASLGAGILKLRRWAADGEVWLDGTRLATEVACSNGIRRAVLVVVSKDVSTPLTFGFHRQTIVLPEAARSWDDGLLRRAMRHELEHVRRNDWLLQILARVTVAVYWPHVLVWVAWRRFCMEAERTCDDAVVNSFEPATYASELVAMARSLTHRVRVPALAMASPTRLSERVRAILDPGQARGPQGRVTSIAAIAAVVVILIASGSVRLVADVAAYTDVDLDEGMKEFVVHAAEAGNITRLGQLLERGDFRINQTFDGDGTVLLIAAKHGRIEAVRFLLDRGADPNVPSPGDGNPLIAAARAGQVEIAKLLLERRARIDEVVPGDENALITACDAGQVDMVRLLIARGANVNLSVRVENMENDKLVTEVRTPLRMAHRSGVKPIIEMLVAAGARE